MSGLPETDVARVQRWCRARVPERVRDQVRVEADIASRHVTVVECRPPWRADMGTAWTRFPIARLRYVKATGQWSLYWAGPEPAVPCIRPGGRDGEYRGLAGGGRP